MLLVLAGCGRLGFAPVQQAGRDAQASDASLDASADLDASASRDASGGLDASTSADAPLALDTSMASSDSAMRTALPDGAMGCISGVAPELRFAGYTCPGTCSSASSSGDVDIDFVAIEYTGSVHITVADQATEGIIEDRLIDACVGQLRIAVGNTGTYLARMTSTSGPLLEDQMVLDIRID